MAPSADSPSSQFPLIDLGRVLRRILSYAIAERPVLLCHFNQVDKYILRADAGSGRKGLRDCSIEAALHFNGATLVQRDLDQHNVIGARNAEVRWVVDQGVGFVLTHDLKAIFGWYIQNINRDLEATMNLFSEKGYHEGLPKAEEES